VYRNFCTSVNYQNVDIKYTKDHEWVEIDKTGKTATLGITDFAQKSLGDIVFVELPQVGSFIKKKGYY
jgi:glycine cleavage system H protein